MDTPQEIIELSSSSDDEYYETEVDVPQPSPRRTRLEPFDFDAFLSQDNADEQGLAPDLDEHVPGASYDYCLNEITEVFPDISHDHVKQLYEKHSDPLLQDFANSRALSQSLIEQILDAGKYPKEKDRLREIRELKRKREDPRSPEEEAARWKNDALNLKLNRSDYTKVA